MERRWFSDPTDDMDLEVGTWKGLSISPPREVNSPTYEIVGEVARYDTRDHVYSRMVLREGTPEYEDYYSRHPEKKALDEDKRRRAEKSGEKRVSEDAVNEYLSIAGFYGTMALSRPRIVEAKLKMILEPVGRMTVDRLKVDPNEMSRKMKAFGLHLGATKVRIAELNQNWVYTHEPLPAYGQPVELNYKYVICLAVWQHPFLMASHTGIGQSLEVGWKYSVASHISIIIANYIRSLGWQARPLPTFNCPIVVCPVFVDAGIGEYGRCGFVVTKEFGNNWRPGGVATDMPLIPDKPVDFGLQSFCEKCTICADYCPSKAIPKGDKEIVRGVRRWQIDAERCYTYWNTIGTSCGTCQVVCPWNHGNNWFHNSLREVAERFPNLKSSLIAAEKFFYGKHKPSPEPKWMT